MAPVSAAPVGRRPALDGVRALAVTAVAVYHFGGGDTSALPGGFLGVDVFFVLSGYLITGLLLAEFGRTGRIDLVAFWVRRLRRLMPALLVMVLVVSGWVWWATPPDAYPGRRSDVFWTLGYLANWHLVRTSETYFAAYGSASPLRHAWSLAVEEQFYLVWPALALGLMWLGRRWLGHRIGAPTAVAVAALVGIAASATWMATAYLPLYPSAAYYGTQGRVQELFVGVLLATVIGSVRDRRPAVTAAGVAGLVGLLAAIAVMSDDGAFFYSGGALLVCLATAGVITGVELAPRSRLARAFSWRPAVALGRISYGVYLWHWPLVVMIPLSGSWGERWGQQALRVALTLGAATASFVLVEQPVQRSRRVLHTSARVVGAAAVSVALVVAVSIPATALPGTLADQVSQSSDRACPGEAIDVLRTCTWPAGHSPDRPVGIALLGDSTARALAPGLDDWARSTGKRWLEAAWKRCTAAGVTVLAGSEPAPDIPSRACRDQGARLIRDALAADEPPVVLVAEFWGHHQRLLVDGQRLAPGTPAHDAALRAGYEQVVEQVAAYGGRVVFVELPPPGEQLGAQVAGGRPAGSARPPVGGNGRFVDGFNALLQAVAADYPGVASTVSVTDLICPQGRCAALQGDLLVRRDGVHYSIGFARRLVPELLRRSGVGLT